MVREFGLAMVLVGVFTAGAHAQCQRGGGTGTAASSAGQTAIATSSVSATPRLLTGYGSLSYDQMLGQQLQRQLVMQRYQKMVEDQARRAERLKLRQYWAAVRREQKAQDPAAISPGKLAARPSSAPSMTSLVFSPAR
jgi:hypothetical protein